jgi:hypothetical protein
MMLKVNRFQRGMGLIIEKQERYSHLSIKMKMSYKILFLLRKKNGISIHKRLLKWICFLNRKNIIKMNYKT